MTETMFSIYMIIALLVATALTKGSIECNFLQCNGTCQCRAAAGQPLIFHLTNKVDTSLILMKHDKDRILKRETRGKTVKFFDEYKKEFEDLNNGTVKLRNAAKTHSGDYLLEEHDCDGVLQRNVTVHLEIQAPVSEPAASQTCLSPEQMKVSCSSEGDGAEIILYLENNLLIHSGATEKHDVTVSLYGQMTGNLTCDVQNNVSREQTVIQLTSCSGNISSNLSPLTVALISSVATLLLLLAVILGIKCFNQTMSNKTRRNKTMSNKTPRNKTTSPVTVNNDDVEDEIIYSDVKVTTAARKTRHN